MLRILRQIRKQFMEQNKTRSYILYAIGEILLVVIGILIALQVNNWNNDLNNQRIAQDYTELLLADLRADTTMLQTLIDESLEKHENARKLMRLYHDNVNLFEDTLSVFTAIQDIGRTDSPSLRDNTYNDMVNTGSIKLIEDRSTVDALMTYYTRNFSDWSDEYFHRLWREYLPQAIDLLPSDFLEDHVKIIIDTNIEIRMENYVSEANPELPEEVLSAFRENEEMDFLLKSVSRTHLVHVNFLQRSKDMALEAINHLETRTD